MSQVKQRELGKTGLMVSAVGFGAFKIGRNEKTKYAAHYDLPSDAEAERILYGVLDLGIRHIDTAPAYGLSEDRIGRLLASRKDEFIVSTKVGEAFEDGQSRYDFSEQAVRLSIEQSRQRLGRDQLEIVTIHAPADDIRVLKETPVVDTLMDFRAKGIIRAIGLSGKTTQAAMSALEWADVLMVEFHPQDQSHADVIAAAKAKGVGVIVKKGLASGRLPAEEAIPFILKTPGVSNLVIGGLSLSHFEENLRLASVS